MSLTTLGNKVSKFQGFETFPAPKNLGNVTFTSSEVTARCPMTDQPDFYTVEVSYLPRDLCVESKTVKLYFQQFREHGEFVEAFTRRISRDFFLALNPYEVIVKVTQTPRGGWGISVTDSLYPGMPEVRAFDPATWNGGFLEETNV